MARRRRQVPIQQMVSQRDLDALTKQCINYRTKAKSAAGHRSELIREYAETKNLHRGAWAWIEKLETLEPGALWLWLAHFDDMRSKRGLDKRAKEQGQLLDANGKARDVEEYAGEAA